ncbi:MAG: PIN domain-containing protein [Candidatus Aminicenantes bacterium]|nr:PIN domain-containing protein [Candidatus Aminicenantes bacterium]
MSDKYFIDTNIFVYSFDTENPQKNDIAKRLIADALENGTGIISYQVIQEFLNVATQKFAKPLTFKDSQRYLNVVLESLCEVFSSTELFHKALEIINQWKYPFYDSLIIAAALQGDCAVIYTENMQHDQTIRDLTIKNPFIDSP